MYEARKTRRSGLSTQAHVRVARMGEGVQQITWAHSEDDSANLAWTAATNVGLDLTRLYFEGPYVLKDINQATGILMWWPFVSRPLRPL